MANQSHCRTPGNDALTIITIEILSDRTRQQMIRWQAFQFDGHVREGNIIFSSHIKLYYRKKGRTDEYYFSQNQFYDIDS